MALEVSMEDAPKLIHIQNYADKVRILKANVGKDDTGEVAAESEAQPEATEVNPAEDVVQPEAAPVQTEPAVPAAPANKKIIKD